MFVFVFVCVFVCLSLPPFMLHILLILSFYNPNIIQWNTQVIYVIKTTDKSIVLYILIS
jgi:hypothetical protein